MAKVISISLNAKDIDEAIKELEEYQKDVLAKTDLFRQRLAEEMAKEAQSLFNGAIVDDLITGGSRSASVTVESSDNGKIAVVIAKGEDAVWVEFGAGVYYNGSVGSSPHPQGSNLGFTIGSYGKGYGKGNAWGFYEDGELKITRGTPAIMPMYNSMKSIIDRVISIAREVWK